MSRSTVSAASAARSAANAASNSATRSSALRVWLVGVVRGSGTLDLYSTPIAPSSPRGDNLLVNATSAPPVRRRATIEEVVEGTLLEGAVTRSTHSRG